RHFAFAATPEQMNRALRTGLPADTRIEALLEDLLDDYGWLFQQHGQMEHRDWKTAPDSTPQLQSLGSKFLYLYQSLESTHGTAIAYPWMPFRFTAMNAAQVRAVAAEAVRWQLWQPIQRETWSTP